MTSQKKILLFLVDDDALFLKSLAIEFGDWNESTVKTFSTGEQCIENISMEPDFIVLDYFLNSVEKNAINGLETLDKIKIERPNIPVIMLSSQDKIDVAVNCMKHHAFDYVVKSETAFLRLQKAITVYLHNKNIEKLLGWYMDKMGN